MDKMISMVFFSRIRNEIFWSNSNFTSGILQTTFSFGSKSKTSKNILPCQFGKIGNNFIVGHARRQPTQHIINGNTRIPYARFSKTFFGTNAMRIIN